MRAIMISAVAAVTMLAACENMGTTDEVVVADGTETAVVATADANPPASGDSPLPILGTWSCGTVGFTVTPGTFQITNGSSSRIDSIDRLAIDDYRLTLQDAKKIRLSKVLDDKLTYQHENAEGDAAATTAACTRRM